MGFRWMPATTQNILNPEFTVQDLKEGAQYEFRVLAENKAGFGPPSDPSVSVIAKAKYGEFF